MTILGEAFVAVRPETTGFGTETEGLLRRSIGAIPAPAIFAAIAVAGIGTALAIGEEFQGAYKKIRSATGATVEDMAGLEGSFKKVLASGPATMNQVADALSLVSVRTKMSGGDLEALTETELKLARITGVDVKNVVDSTTKVFANWGIQGVGPSKLALDQLLVISQKTGIGIDQLSNSVVGKAGAIFRDFGVSMGSAATIMGSLESQGVPTSAVMMSLNKAFVEAQKTGKDAHTVLGDLFNTLKTGTPGTAAYTDAIGILGSRGFGVLKDMVDSGKVSIDMFTGAMDSSSAGTIDRVAKQNQTLGGLFATLKNQVLVALEPISMAVLQFADVVIRGAVEEIRVGFGIAQQAIEVFVGYFTGEGSDAVVAGSSSITEAIGNLGIIARDVFDVLSQAWFSFITTFMAGDGDIASSGFNGYVEQFGYIARQVADFVGDHLTPILIGLGVAVALTVAPFWTIAAGLIYAYTQFDVFRNVVDSVAAAFVSFAAGFIDRWQAIEGAIKTVLIGIGISLAMVLGPAILAWTFFHDQILAVVMLVWNQVWAVIETSLRVVLDVFDFFTNLLSGNWSDAWAALADIPAAFVDYITATISNLGTFLIDFFATLLPNIGDAIGAVFGVIEDALGKIPIIGPVITGVFDVIGFAIGVLRSAFEIGFGLIVLIFQTAWDTATVVWNVTGAILFDAIGLYITAWQVGIGLIFDALTSAFGHVWGIFNDLWNSVGAPLFDLIKTAVSLFVDPGLKSIFDLIITFWNLAWAGVQLVWDTIGSPIFEGVKAFIGLEVDGIKIVFGWLTDAWDLVWSGAQVIWDTVGAPIFSAIRGAIDLANTYIGIMRDIFSDIFGTLWGTLQTVWDNTGAKLFGAMRSIIDGITGAIDAAVGALGHLIDLMNAANPFANSGFKDDALKAIPRSKGGTGPGALGFGFHPGGVGLVGEEGPELAFLPRGSYLARNSETRKMLGGGPSLHAEFHPGAFVIGNNVDEGMVRTVVSDAMRELVVELDHGVAA